jgi:hypothetical protein
MEHTNATGETNALNVEKMDIASNIVSKNKTRTRYYSLITKPRLNGN